MRLSSAKTKYHGRWLAFRFTDESKEEGRVLLSDKDRHRLHQRLLKPRYRKAGLYVTYAGPLLPKEYSVIL